MCFEMSSYARDFGFLCNFRSYFLLHILKSSCVNSYNIFFKTPNILIRGIWHIKMLFDDKSRHRNYYLVNTMLTVNLLI